LTSTWRTPVWRTIVLACWSLAAAAAHAVFPDRPVHIIVPMPPGGLADMQARMIAEKLSNRWMRPVIIENRPGAGSTIAAAYVARAPADGYSLLLVGPSHVITGTLYHNLPYHALQSFQAVALIGTSPFVLVTRPDLPANSVAELVQLAARREKGLSFATSGIGTAPHLAGELMRFTSMARFMHIPYKGTAEALTALEGGHVDFAILDVSVANLVDKGVLKALAVTTAERSARLPKVRTMNEQGVTGCDVAYWSGLLAPAGTPHAVIEQLNAAVHDVLESSELRTRFDAMGLHVIDSTPGDYADLLMFDYLEYARTIRITGVMPE
jgi:tripartite-type tricarboxylate transporter receptor subunit TctC